VGDDKGDGSDNDIDIVLESNDSETVFTLRMESINNKKITGNELVLAVEAWLTEVTRAQDQLDRGPEIH
jgi:hypothetical protein